MRSRFLGLLVAIPVGAVLAVGCGGREEDDSYLVGRGPIDAAVPVGESSVNLVASYGPGQEVVGALYRRTKDGRLRFESAVAYPAGEYAQEASELISCVRIELPKSLRGLPLAHTPPTRLMRRLGLGPCRTGLSLTSMAVAEDVFKRRGELNGLFPRPDFE